MERLDKHLSSKILLFTGVAIHIVFLISLISGFLNPLFLDSMYCSGQGADFYSIYQAAQNVHNGQSVYETQPMTKSVPYFYEYRYLPFIALTIGQFFLLFSPHIAYMLWLIFQEACLGINIYITRRYFVNTTQRNIASSLWLLFTPYYLELYLGQFSFFMTTLILSAVYLWQHQKKLTGNLLWIGSLLVKTLSIVFVPVLIKLKNTKTVLLGLIIVIVLSLPYFMIQPGAFDIFLRNFNEGLSVETLDGNQGFEALVCVALVRTSNPLYYQQEHTDTNVADVNASFQLPLLLWAIFIYGLSLFITIRSSSNCMLELFCLWILTYFLTYKHIWEHHYVLLLPLYVFLYYKISSQQLKNSISGFLFWAGFIITALPTLFIFLNKSLAPIDCEYSWSGFDSILWHAPKPIIILILYISVVRLLYKNIRKRL